MKIKILVPAVLLVAVLAALTKVFLFKSEFLYLGTIEATRVDISPRVASIIGQINVQEGQKVKMGDVLVRLAAEDLKLNADKAGADLKRADSLFRKGSMSQEALDHLRFKWEDAKMRLDWTQIKAPLNGTVLDTYREAGEWISPGAKLLTLSDLQRVWALVYVAQPMLAKIALGMKVDGVIQDLKDHKFQGKISKISDEAEFTPKNVQTQAERTRLVFGVKVVFDNIDEVLKPGMSIEVRLPE